MDWIPHDRRRLIRDKICLLHNDTHVSSFGAFATTREFSSSVTLKMRVQLRMLVGLHKTNDFYRNLHSSKLRKRFFFLQAGWDYVCKTVGTYEGAHSFASSSKASEPSKPLQY